VQFNASVESSTGTPMSLQTSSPPPPTTAAAAAVPTAAMATTWNDTHWQHVDHGDGDDDGEDLT
jgi:hypothetical protein